MSRVAHPAGPRHGDVLPADHPPAAPDDLNALYPGIWPRGARRSGGVLTLGGVDVRDLAAEFGTPLYVCDEEDVRSRCREYLEAFGPDGRVFYAAKAFCSRAVLRWVSSEGLGVDVCTGGELEVALSAGVPPEQITLHGNNKTLGRAVPRGLGRRGPHRGGLVRGDRPAGLPGRQAAGGPGPTCWSGSPPGWRRTPTSSWRPRTTTRSSASRWPPGAADEAVRRVHRLPGPVVRRAALAHRLADLRHGRLRGGGAPGGRAGASGSATSTASRSPSSTSAAGSASPTPRRTTRPRSRSWRRACATIVDGQCRAAGLARPRLTVEPGRGIVGPVHGDAVHGGHDQGRGRAADLRQRGRRDERQHQDRAVRRLLRRARWPPARRRPRRCCPGWWAGTARAATSWSGTRTCRPTWPPATCWPCRPPAPTAGRWPATTTTSRARPWSRSARARPATIVRRETLDDLLQPGRRMTDPENQPCPTLKVALLGCGVVGSAGGPAAHRAGRRPGPARRRPAGAGRDRGAAGRAPAGRRDRPRAAHRGRARAGHPARHRHRGRGDRRHRAGQVADAGRAEGRQAGGHREQGPARRERRGDLRGGPRVRGRPVLRGLRGRRHPAAAAAARVAGRGHRAPRARHRQRHHQLHPRPDGLLGRGLRRVARGGAGARLRRGRPDRRRRGVRRGREGGHPGRPGLPHPGDRGGRAPRGHHRGHRRRHRSAPGRSAGWSSCSPSASAATAASRSGCTRR